MRHLRAVGAAVLLGLVLFGGPIGLLSWGTSPAVLLNWTVPDTGRGLLAILTIVGAACWFAFALSVVVEVLSLLSRRRLSIRLPLLSGVQGVAAGLVVAAFSGAVVAPAAKAALPSPAPERTVVAAPIVVAPTDLPVARPGYTVQPGDDLWSIAEDLLGDGGKWRVIAEANPELAASPTKNLVAGSRLLLPETPQRHDKPKRLTVARGDTLSELAERHLGDAAEWPRIQRANDDLIADPDLIQIGWSIIIPTHAAADPGDQHGKRPVRKPIEPTGATTRPSTPQPTTSAVPSPPPIESRVVEADPASPLIGGISGAAAATVLGAIGVRRLGQLRSRPVGSRIAHPPVDVRRYETALGHRGGPNQTELLETALRTMAAHSHRTGEQLAELDQVRLYPDRVVFSWTGQPGSAPPGFDGAGREWQLTTRNATDLPASTHPVPFPALVTLGRRDDGGWLMVDLETRSPLRLSADRELRHAAVAAMAVELGCSPWASELSLVVVGGDEFFVRAACPEFVRFDHDAGAVAAEVQEWVMDRGSEERAVAVMRVDPDTAEAAGARIVLFADEVEEAVGSRLEELLADGHLGIGCLLAGKGHHQFALSGSVDEPHGVLHPAGIQVSPQVIAPHTRAAIGAIFVATDLPCESPAPWWGDEGVAGNVRPLVPRQRGTAPAEPPAREPADHPDLLLVGPVQLVGAQGVEPSKAIRQCAEYCAWLLENPGRTATQMASSLIVAETTRRSNMSRLRTWLGQDPDGNAYLPEAYSGRIELHRGVTSDWQRMQVLVAPGVNRVSPETLIAVLELVRGAPLADAAPGQWQWAEELRTDISSVVRDAGVMLARHAIAQSDLELARWATNRALRAAPDDELLLGERIRAEHQGGNHEEVSRLVERVTRHARRLGIDLGEELVVICQEALEGRVRARA